MTGLKKGPLRFGIVGCGLIGEKRLNALPKGSLVVACDLVYEKASALASKAGSGCIATQSLSDLVAAKPDAVIVSTINCDLASVAAQMIQNGSHVLIEKPVAMSLEEVDRLWALSHHHNVLVRAGYNHRYHPSFQKARSIVGSPDFGKLMFIRGRYGHGGRVNYHHEWRSDPIRSGGGELIDQGVHLIDLAGWFLGPWASVSGNVHTYYWDMPVDDNAFLLLHNGAGNAASLHVSCTEWKNLFSFEIYGTTAKLHIEGLGGSYGLERLYHYQMLPEMGPPQTVIYEFPRADESWALETHEFLEDIRLHRVPVPGLVEARAVLAVVETIYRKQSGI